MNRAIIGRDDAQRAPDVRAVRERDGLSVRVHDASVGRGHLENLRRGTHGGKRLPVQRERGGPGAARIAGRDPRVGDDERRSRAQGAVTRAVSRRATITDATAATPSTRKITPSETSVGT